MKIMSRREIERNFSNKIASRGNRELSEMKREFYNLADRLGVGEGLHVERSEWAFKSEPYVGSKLGVKRFTVHNLTDKSGWMVRRVA